MKPKNTICLWFNKDAQEAARRRYAVYQQLAGITVPLPETTIDDGGLAATPERQV